MWIFVFKGRCKNVRGTIQNAQAATKNYKTLSFLRISKPTQILDTVLRTIRLHVTVCTYNAPIGVNLFNRNRVEDNADHQLGEDGAVLDEPVVVRGGLLLHHRHNPLQHFSLQLKIFL